MSVETIYAPSTQAGNGVKVAFDFAFKITASTDLVVTKFTAAGVEGAALTLGTDYTVEFDAAAETGTVTFTVAPVNGGSAKIVRRSDKTQATVYPREGTLPAKTTEAAIDKLTMLVQELAYFISLLDAGDEFSPSESSGLASARPTAPANVLYYYSTDLGSYEKWVPAAQRWFLLG